MVVNSKRKFDNGPTNNRDKKPFEVPKKKAVIGFAGKRQSSSSEISEDEQINSRIFTKTEHGIVEGGQLKRPMPLQIKGPLDKMFNNSVKYTET